VDCGTILTDTDVGTLRICVERTGGVYGTAEVQVDSGDDTATAGTDYTAIVAEVLQWADGEGGVKCFDVTIDPTGDGGGLAFTLTLSAWDPVGAEDDTCDVITVEIGDAPA